MDELAHGMHTHAYTPTDTLAHVQRAHTHAYTHGHA